MGAWRSTRNAATSSALVRAAHASGVNRYSASHALDAQLVRGAVQRAMRYRVSLAVVIANATATVTATTAIAWNMCA